MRKPSDYAHAYGEPMPFHGGADAPVDAPWEPVGPEPCEPGESAQHEGVPQGMELATFRLLYESQRICVFETRDGHLTAVDVNRLA